MVVFALGEGKTRVQLSAPRHDKTFYKKIMDAVQQKGIALYKYNFLAFFITFFCTSLAIFLPVVLPHTPSFQLLMGSIISVSLILILVDIGLLNAVVFGTLPPILAVLFHQVPDFARPIMILFAFGNIALVLGIYFSLQKKRSLSLAVLLGGLLKLCFLAISGYVFFNFLQIINTNAYHMLGRPIVYNTGLGIIMAVIYLKLKKYDERNFLARN